MDAMQQARHKRHEAVRGVLDTHQAVWAANAAMTAARATLNTGIEYVVGLQQTQGTVITGVTQDKTAARLAAAEAAVLVAGAVAAYADKTNDHELFAKVNFTVADLIYGKEEDDETAMALILEAGTANLAAILPDGTLTQADLNDLDAKLEAWETLITKPRQAKAGTKAATNQLPAALLANDRTISRQLDRLMERYRRTNPAFFQADRSELPPTPPPPGP